MVNYKTITLKVFVRKRCPLKPDKLLFDFLIIWWDLSKYTRRKMQIQSKNKGGDFTDWTNHEIKSPEIFWKFEKYKYSLKSVDKIQGGKILPIRLCLSLFQNDHAIYSFYSDQYFWGDCLTTFRLLQQTRAFKRVSHEPKGLLIYWGNNSYFHERKQLVLDTLLYERVTK